MEKNESLLSSSQELKYYSLCNFYSSSIMDLNHPVPSRLKCNVTIGGWVCFGRIIHRLNPDQIYSDIDITVEAITDSYLITNRNIRHYCFFTKDELEYYLSIISSEYGFKYIIKESSNSYNGKQGESISCFDINIKMERATKARILWILNLIRHTYEFPFNVFLRDAIKLKSIPEFENQHIANLLQIVATMASCRFDPNVYVSFKNLYPLNQSLGHTFRNLIDLSELNRQLDLKDLNYITRIYGSMGSPKIELSDTRNDIKKLKQIFLPYKKRLGLNDYSITSFGYWFNSESWERNRLKLYKDYYDNFLKDPREKLEVQ